MTTTATGTATTALQVLQESGWNYRKATSNPKRTYQGPCPVGNHENDHIAPAFSLSQDGQAFFCFKCDFKGYGPQQMREKLGQEPIRTPRPAPADHQQQRSKAFKKERKQLQGATLAALAQDKGMDVDYLKYLGWRDSTHRRVKAVAMPYKDQAGQQAIVKYRVGVNEGVKTLWPAGTKIIPMGLQELDFARNAGYVVLVEGETDWVTLDYDGFPALGLPGVHSWKGEWLTYTNGIEKVYVWEESGGSPNRDGLTPGQQMVKRVADSQGEVWVIKAPEGAKDPTELRQLVGAEAFPDRMNELLESAERVTGEGYREANPGPKPRLSDKPYKAPWKTEQGCLHIHHRLEKWARQHGKPLRQTTLVYKHQEHIRDLHPHDAEFRHLQEGAKLDINTLNAQEPESCIALDNPNLIMGHEQLQSLCYAVLGITDLNGDEVPASKKISECGKDAAANCPQHGHQYYYRHACRSRFCPLCPTRQSSNLARTRLPDVGAGEAYTEYWIETVHPLPVEDPRRWQATFTTLMDTWEKTIAKLARRKAYKGKILYRSHTSYYTQFEAQTHWKLMVKETELAEALEAVEELAEALEGQIAVVQRYQNGVQATTQLVADTMTTLVGIDPSMPFSDQCAIFAAHYFATQGRHIFQSLGELHKLLQELTPEPPPKCPICSQKLEEVLLDSNPEHQPARSVNGMGPPKHPNCRLKTA